MAATVASNWPTSPATRAMIPTLETSPSHTRCGSAPMLLKIILFIWSLQGKYLYTQTSHKFQKPPKSGGRGERKYLNGNRMSQHLVPRYPLPTPLLTGYSIMPKKHLYY